MNNNTLLLALGTVASIVTIGAISAADAQFPAYDTDTTTQTERAVERGERGERVARGENSEQGQKGRHGRKGKKGGMKFLHNNEDVNSTTIRLSNGVQTTYTFSDPETFTMVQERNAAKQERKGDKAAKEGMEKTVEFGANSMVVTVTSDDPEKQEKIFEKADKVELKKSIDTQTEKTANGVVITITSDNAEAVEMIQNREQKEGRGGDKITKTKTDIADGVQITVTTEDEEVLAKMHETVDNGGFPRFGKRGRGNGGRK